ncbi:hypothetical protein [Paenibacillus campi]|uniref:hypothetical protein n=1 Tax=Paenibacillus campi TaxID=3106031 RepID=UPI002AFEBB26|nr:hypothetical protein [Paenibacillus sp. SGZ-1014]
MHEIVDKTRAMKFLEDNTATTVLVEVMHAGVVLAHTVATLMDATADEGVVRINTAHGNVWSYADTYQFAVSEITGRTVLQLIDTSMSIICEVAPLDQFFAAEKSRAGQEGTK